MGAEEEITPCAVSSVQLGRSCVTLKKPLGIGTMQWGTTWLDSKLNRGGNLSEAQCRQIFSTLVSQLGISFFDTAEGYGGGTSEEMLAAVATSLEKEQPGTEGARVVFGTKFLPHLGRWSQSSLSRALRGSNSRLNVDCCDVYFIHTPVHPMPLEHWVAAAAEEANRGRIKAIGLSNCNAGQVRRACAAAERHGQSIACNQIMYNLLCHGSPSLRETERACRDLGVTIIAYSPIGQGLLTEGLTPEKFGRIRLARMSGVSLEQLQPLRSAVERCAAAHGVSMAQVCINWTVCHSAVPLVGCRSVEQAADCAGALSWRLSDAEIAELDARALALSTLEKPRWRRALFVALISLLVLAYKLCRLVESALKQPKRPPPSPPTKAKTA